MICLLSIILIFNLPFQTKTMPTNDQIERQLSKNRKELASSKSRVLLLPYKYRTKVRSWVSLLDEDFESGMPAGWIVINGNGDSYTWTVGASGMVSPPDHGDSYCLYNDDAAGEFNISGDSIQTPFLGIPDSITSLYLSYGYGHSVYEGESLKVQVRYHDGASWEEWQQLKSYGAYASGTDNFVLDKNKDSLQVMWLYRDNHTASSWGWGSCFDNVLIEYFLPKEKDAGMFAINSPVSDTLIEVFVPVNGTVKNYGTDTFSFEATVNIYDPDLITAFTNTIQIDSLAPADTQNINFGSFQLTKEGIYTVEMFTYASDDMDFGNDTLTTTFNSSDSSYYSWESIPSPGIRNHEHAVVYDPDNDLFFIIGGDSTGNQTNMDVCLEFDPKTNTWQTKQPMPTKRLRHRSAYRNGYIHVLCGKNISCLSTHEVYDIGGDSWDTAATAPLAVTNPSVVPWKDSLIYLIGGYDESHTARTEVNFYDAITNSWYSATSLPRRLHSGSTDIKGDSIFIIGGADGSLRYTNILIGVINPTDPSIINWSWGDLLPIYDNSSNMLAIKNNKAYMIGGHYNDGTNEVWEHDILNQNWSALPDYPTPFISRGDFAKRRNGPDSLGTLYSFMGDTSDYWTRKPTDKCYRLVKESFSGIEEDKKQIENAIAINSTINFTNEITINYTIEERCDLKINMYDILGREIFSHLEKDIAPGQNQFTIQENFKNGIYFVRVEAGPTAWNAKVILIR